MNKFESVGQPNMETNYGRGYEDLVKHYGDLEAKERAKEKVECGARIEEFEELIAPWLQEKILGVLRSINTEDEAPKSEKRRLAKEALIPIADKLKFLDWRTDITKEKFEELRAKYKIVSNAVGFINKGAVDHNR